MINIIIPIIENPLEYEKFVDRIAKSGIVFVGIRESLAKDFNPQSKNIKILKFADNSKREEIINALNSCKFKKGKILIARRPLTEKEYTQLTSSNADISVLKKKRNRFVSAFRKMIAKIILKIFNFSYFDDISGVCYAENMFELLSVCSNLSMVSRINRYIGLNIEEFETTNKTVKKECNRFKSISKFLLSTLFWLGSIASVVLINIFTPLIIVAILFEILWLVVATTLWVISILNFSRALAVGDVRFGRAEEI